MAKIKTKKYSIPEEIVEEIKESVIEEIKEQVIEEIKEELPIPEPIVPPEPVIIPNVPEPLVEQKGDSISKAIEKIGEVLNKNNSVMYAQVLELIKQNQNILNKIIEQPQNEEELAPCLHDVNKNLLGLSKVVAERPCEHECQVVRHDGLISKIIIKAVK